MYGSVDLDVIAGIMFVNVIIACGALKAYHNAWVCKKMNWTAHVNDVSTQNKRYRSLFLGQLLMTPFFIWFCLLGLDNVYATMKVLTQGAALYMLFGPALTIMAIATLLSPVLTIVSFLRVYALPARLAKYTGRGRVFYTTAGMRDGTEQTIDLEATTTEVLDLLYAKV